MSFVGSNKRTRIAQRRFREACPLNCPRSLSAHRRYAGGAVSARARRGMVLTYHPTVWLARLTVVVASLLIARLILKMMPGNF